MSESYFYFIFECMCIFCTDVEVIIISPKMASCTFAKTTTTKCTTYKICIRYFASGKIPNIFCLCPFQTFNNFSVSFYPTGWKHFHWKMIKYCIPSIVYVLPAPVCPYANTVPLNPLSTESTNGRNTSS